MQLSYAAAYELHYGGAAVISVIAMGVCVAVMAGVVGVFAGGPSRPDDTLSYVMSAIAMAGFMFTAGRSLGYLGVGFRNRPGEGISDGA